MKQAPWFDTVRNEDFGIQSWEQSPQVMGQAHRHDEVELNYLTSGSITYQWGGDLVTVFAGHLALFWAAVPHQVISTDPESHMFVFTMPLAQTLQWKLPQRMEQMLLSGRLLLDSQLLESDRSQCQLWHKSIREGEPDAIETTQIEMYGRLRRMNTHLSKTSAEAKAVTVVSLPADGRPVQVMSHYIATRYLEPISVSDVAEAANLHPGYAMSLFRQTVGRTIGDYINQYRLFHARRLLMTTDLKVLDIAFDSGFGSASRFYESFSTAYNETPSKFRTRSRRQA